VHYRREGGGERGRWMASGRCRLVPHRRLVSHRPLVMRSAVASARFAAFARRQVMSVSIPRGRPGLTTSRSRPYVTERSFLLPPDFEPGLFDPGGTGRVPGQNERR